MNMFIQKISRAFLALVLAVGGLALTGSYGLAAPVSLELCALTGTATLTGAVTVPIWGFGIPSTPGDCSTATASLPGPVLSVNEGDVVTITLDNALPAGHILEFEIPGMTFSAGPTDGSVPITFTASRPGTYIYQSGGDAGRQEAMGLYGAFIVQSLTAGLAYDSAATAFDVEATLVLSAVDPNFNAAPDTFDMNDYLGSYWLINGKAYPDTTSISAATGERLLLRYVNAGFDNTSMMLLGSHEQVLARDAYLLNNPFSANTETIPAGGTEDAIVTVMDYGTAPSANGFPLFNRNLHVTNGSPASDPGGMLTFIAP
jgi:FtsP/CotA-like multicopper oxidase with cupredoxin domain